MENRLVSNVYELMLLVILILICSVNVYFIIKVFITYVQNDNWIQITLKVTRNFSNALRNILRLTRSLLHRSPSKSKKTKAFKFPSKKEKREKSREKEAKEKDAEKEKDKKKKEKDEKDVDKEKRKDKDKDKSKQKLKDRKKGKHEGLDIGGKIYNPHKYNWYTLTCSIGASWIYVSYSSEEQPIFGVSLHLAVERSCCHDGVKLPLVVRDCVDYVEEHGMNVEGLYKVPGVKSKIQHLKKLYNNREPVNISEFEPTVATSLLILFLRFVCLRILSSFSPCVLRSNEKVRIMVM